MSIKINLIALDAVLLGRPEGYRTANPFRVIMLSVVPTYNIYYTKIISVYMGVAKSCQSLMPKGLAVLRFKKEAKRQTDQGGCQLGRQHIEHRRARIGH